MPGKTPNSNGKEPVEHAPRNNQDVDMTDEKSSMKGKKGNNKEGEDMTVVVPVPKNTRQTSAPPPPDAEGDVAMGDSEKAEDLEVKVDPVTQAITGMSKEKRKKKTMSALLHLRMMYLAGSGIFEIMEFDHQKN